MKKVLAILFCALLFSVIAHTADASTIHFHEFEYHYTLGILTSSSHNHWTIEMNDGSDDVYHYHYVDEYYYSFMPNGKKCLSSEYESTTVYKNYVEIYHQGEWTHYDNCPGL